MWRCGIIPLQEEYRLRNTELGTEMKTDYESLQTLDLTPITTLEDLLEGLECKAIELGWPVRLQILLATEPVDTVFRKWGTQFEARQLSLPLRVWELIVPRRPPFQASIQWFVVEHSRNVLVLITNEHVDLLRTPLNRWISHYRPLFSPMLLNTTSMRSILNSISRMNQLQGRVMLNRVSWRGRLMEPTQRKLLESSQVWTDRPYDEVFDELRDQRKWPTSVHFHFSFSSGDSDHGCNQVEGSMSKGGEFTSSGCLHDYFASVVSVAADQARGDQSFFAGRAVQDSAVAGFKPLIVKYDEPVFADRSQNRLLARVLESLPNAGVSVLHPNPYLRAAVVDYVDGSVYDIWVVCNDRITIVPKSRATSSALERLCAHICADFRDGTIGDYVEIEDGEDSHLT